jgi:glycosyltransferase involved in cell wall biosynthesis
MPKIHEVLVSHLVGGAAVLAVRLAGAARERGVPCAAWVPGPGPASASLDREQVAWRRYDLPALQRGRAAQLAACARMLPGFAAASRPIVHVHNPLVYRFLVPALVAARARTIVHFHIEPTPDEIRWALGYPPHHVITCAHYIAESIRQVAHERQPDLQVTAVPNAIDTSRFTPGDCGEARARVGFPTSRFVSLVLANLAPHKGQETAVRATALLKQRGIETECWLAGEDRSGAGDFERRLRSLCAELGVQDNVRFLGFRTDAPDLIRAANVLLLPSTHEGLPLTVLEAQAAHVPVIGSTIPGIREVIRDGDNGFIVPADDAAGYADRMHRLLANDAQRRGVIAAAARKVAEEHNWQTFEQRVFAIYESLGLRQAP